MIAQISGPLRWLPLIVLGILAIAFEPMRSGFVLANQSCEITANVDEISRAIFNPRHIISYGVLFLVAANTLTLRQNRVAKAALGVFLFSVFLEFEQSFFTTGHCRARDLIPNLLGIGLAAVIFRLGSAGWNWLERSKSNEPAR